MKITTKNVCLYYLILENLIIMVFHYFLKSCEKPDIQLVNIYGCKENIIILKMLM